ncbi:MAG: hypothetical protein Tsb0013_14780 [Phycisphaerales bacterium]
MKINCIHCGHGFSVDDSYCEYEGILRCGTCSGVLDVRIEDGLVRAVRPGALGGAHHVDAAPAVQPVAAQHTPAPAAQQPTPPEPHQAEQELDNIMRMADELAEPSA